MRGADPSSSKIIRTSLISKVPFSRRIFDSEVVQMMNMPFAASIDDIEIHYESIGEGDVALVFVGGWGVPTVRKVWRHQMFLSSKYRLVFLDSGASSLKRLISLISQAPLP